MATPEFVLSLRKHVGTELLWLPGATAVIRDPEGSRVLLVRRADNGQWTPVTGIVDPGEHPAEAAIREAEEETSVRIQVDRLALVGVSDVITYANGDRAQYIDHTFACTYLGGNPYPADGENTEVRWYALDDLPQLRSHMRARIEAAVSGVERASLVSARGEPLA